MAKKRGPSPTPTALRLLRGNPGKRPLPENEPQPQKGVPYCPRHIQGEARKEWRRVSRELSECGLLTMIDRAALATYCQAWGRWVEAEDELRKNGVLLKSPGGILRPSPMLLIANHAMDQMRALLPEFGMTPAARTRIQVKVQKDEEDPLDALREGTIAHGSASR